MSEAIESARRMIEGMLSSLDEADLDGVSMDSLRQAMSHPKAAEAVAELMPIEAASVRQGEPAPDFTLPFLEAIEGRSGHAAEARNVTLSDHFGRRPVALVFGSAT